MSNKKRSRAREIHPALPGADVSSLLGHPMDVVLKPVADPAVLSRAQAFAEACRQTQPLAAAGTKGAEQAALLLQESTARASGLSPETCRALVCGESKLSTFANGAHPTGKGAEVIAVQDYNRHHAGQDPGMVNAQKPASNVVDMRVSPDSASRRDLLVQYKGSEGHVYTGLGGQVKTGDPEYITRSLVKMTEKPGYGRTGIVDARYVNPDGTPRVAPDAFTPEQAERLQAAKVNLRGIKDMEARAKGLVEDIHQHGQDGLDPKARHQLEMLRQDITKAYQVKGVVGRAAGAAAGAAASAAILSVLIQAATKGEVDLELVGEGAAQAAGNGVLATAGDAAIYHVASNLGATPEAAKAIAQQSMTGLFCLVAVVGDAYGELQSAQQGDITALDAVAGTSMKTALNLLPLALGPLGLPAIPVMIGAQLAGRWAIGYVREKDRQIAEAQEQDRTFVADMDERIVAFHQAADDMRVQCDETDRLFEQAMGLPNLRVLS